MLACAAAANAQQPPTDAGSQLRDAEKKAPALPRKPPPRLELEAPARPALAAPGVRFLVRDVRFTGNTVYPATLLKWLLHGTLGREAGIAELEEMAARVTRHYRDNGYLVARAYLPQQEIRDGVLEIAVLEGRLGSVELKNDSRVRDAAILGYFREVEGTVLHEDRLERRLLLLSDLSGIGQAGAALRPGERVGESSLALALARPDAPPASVELDNYGSYFTGEWRLGAALELASPAGYGDALSARFTKGMPGLELVQLGYQLPVGANGLRAGVSYSALRYRLGKEFAALDADGSAQSAGATLSYPLARHRERNLTVLAGFMFRDFEDRVGATAAESEKNTTVGTLGLSGDWRDSLGGGGVNAGSLAFAGGRLEIETPEARAADAASVGSHGTFGKLNWSFLRVQRLEERVSLLVSFSGQRASRNLDSSEKFVLGGPYAVRAYPLGEAAGDHGLLGTLEVRYDLMPGVWQASVFADAGEIKVNHAPPPGSGENERTLAGLGIGVTATVRRGLSARAALAWGDERPASGPDRTPWAWLQAALRF
jgi:hemolysin activation/secretion protein